MSFKFIYKKYECTVWLFTRSEIGVISIAPTNPRAVIKFSYDGRTGVVTKIYTEACDSEFLKEAKNLCELIQK